MTILTNIKDEKIIIKTINEKRGEIIEKDVAMIDVDYSLIRYLAQQLTVTDVELNNCCYPIIKKNNTTTTVYRLILEFYSKYDKELKQMLKNKQLEINHINKDKQNNKITNLEILDHKNNIRHSRGLEYDIVMTSQQLQEIQQKSLKDKQQNIDKEYLKRISGLFYKAMNNDVVDEKLLKTPYCYYRFYYIPYSNISNKATCKAPPAVPCPLPTPQFLTNFHTKPIQNLILYHKQYIYKGIVQKNLTLLNRNIERYPSIKQILVKYRILDKDKPYNNILLEFYQKIYKSNRYTISNGDILITTSIRRTIKTIGKHKAFLIMYYLGILERKSKPVSYVAINPTANPTANREPSFIKIKELTDSHFQEINVKCKELVDLNYNSIRYFQIREQFGEETANIIYNNNARCKSNYKYQLKAKADIISILKKNEAVVLEGFITRNKIIHELKLLNAFRRQNRESYSHIKNSFSKFLSSLLLYNQNIKSLLEDEGLIYISLNTKIINNIKAYQKQQKIQDTSHILKPNMKVIVLKNLTK